MDSKILETALARRIIEGQPHPMQGLSGALREPIRIFHGPGDGVGDLKFLSIDNFGSHYWITQKGEVSAETLKIVERFLKSLGARGAVLQERSKTDVMEPCQRIFGEAPESFVVEENGLRYLIRFSNVRHPGLFLDHAPLRSWLTKHGRFETVLNTFCYTGSLSIAAKAGGSRHVTNLDLSKPAIEWSKENWILNEFKESDGDFIFGDVFEWLPRLEKKGRRFDCVIVDPPSSSHGPKGHFSTKKNLGDLLALCVQVLNPRGILICSINSQNVNWLQFEEQIDETARTLDVTFEKVKRLELPESFYTNPSEPEQKYLKGFVLRLR